MKRLSVLLILVILVCFSSEVFAVVCDSEKTVNSIEICTINVSLDIPKNLIAAGAIDLYTSKIGYPVMIDDLACTPVSPVVCSCVTADAVTCTDDELASGCVPSDAVLCDPCTPVAEVLCAKIPNTESRVDYAKRKIALGVKQTYLQLYGDYVADASKAAAISSANAAFPE